MELKYFNTLDYDELKLEYKNYLMNRDYSSSTIDTMIINVLYIWRHGSKDLFWDILISTDFESKAKETLVNLLKGSSKSDVNKSVNRYMAHLRKFK